MAAPKQQTEIPNQGNKQKTTDTEEKQSGVKASAYRNGQQIKIIENGGYQGQDFTDGVKG